MNASPITTKLHVTLLDTHWRGLPKLTQSEQTGQLHCKFLAMEPKREICGLD